MDQIYQSWYIQLNVPLCLFYIFTVVVWEKIGSYIVEWALGNAYWARYIDAPQCNVKWRKV